MRWLAFMIPSSLRDAILRDLNDEASATGRGAWWVACQQILIVGRVWPALFGGAMLTDLRFALRSLWASKPFAIGAVLTFALGIGVNVAVFTVVDRMMLRPLPYADADRLVVMGAYSRDGVGPYGTVSAHHATAVRATHQGIVDLAVVGQAIPFAEVLDGPQTLGFAEASYNVLDVLGVRPLFGRGFTRDDALARQPGILLTYEAWQSRFGGRTDVLGQRLWETKLGVEIIGVLPAGFFVPANTWVGRADGLVLDPAALLGTYTPDARETPPYIRMRPGVSREIAEQELRAIVATSERPLGADIELRLVPVREAMFGRYATYTWLVILATGLVLLMCCANLAGLMLVRGRAREQQTALQLALGASRSRVLRTAVFESLALAGTGTIAALVAVTWMHSALRAFVPEIFRRYAVDATDGRVLWFALGATLVSALVAGVWPALRTTRASVSGVLQQGGGRSGSRTGRGGSIVLAAEAAVAIVLVAGAAMTVRNLIGLSRTELGFQPEGLHSFRMAVPASPDPAARLHALTRVVTVLRDTPGIAAATLGDFFPYEGARASRFLPNQMDSQTFRAFPRYFATLGIPLKAGREFSDDDVASAAGVSILSDEGLKRVWPGVDAADAIGRTLAVEGMAPTMVVGVVGDLRARPAVEKEALLYLPLTPASARRIAIAVRTTMDAAAVTREAEARLSAAGFANPVTLSPVAQRMIETYRDERFRAQLFGAFAGVALLLACVGLYAVAAFEVRQRRVEMGIRLALGATGAGIQRLVIRHAVTPVVAGAAVGLVVAWWAGEFMQTFLHKVDARDPVTLVLVGGVLIVATVMAAWWPSRRASRVDPASVLRSQ